MRPIRDTYAIKMLLMQTVEVPQLELNLGSTIFRPSSLADSYEKYINLYSWFVIIGTKSDKTNNFNCMLPIFFGFQTFL